MSRPLTANDRPPCPGDVLFYVVPPCPPMFPAPSLRVVEFHSWVSDRQKAFNFRRLPEDWQCEEDERGYYTNSAGDQLRENGVYVTRADAGPLTTDDDTTREESN